MSVSSKRNYKASLESMICNRSYRNSLVSSTLNMWISHWLSIWKIITKRMNSTKHKFWWMGIWCWESGMNRVWLVWGLSSIKTTNWWVMEVMWTRNYMVWGASLRTLWGMKVFFRTVFWMVMDWNAPQANTVMEHSKMEH